VQFEADEEGGVVEADPAAVKQILLHLVTNARDAMPKGARCTSKCGARGWARPIVRCTPGSSPDRTSAWR